MAGSVLDRDTAFTIADPLLSSLWIVRVPFVSSLIEVVAETMTAPVHKIAATPRFTAGHMQQYPGIAEIDGLSITFYETFDFRVTNWLKSWRKLVYNQETNVYGVPAIYKKNVILEFYSQFSSGVVKKLTYTGVWPTDQGPYELNYAEDTGRITVQAQFSVDDYGDE